MRIIAGVVQSEESMFFTRFYFRALLLSLVSVGLVVPTWATQPCECGDKGGCCSKKAITSASCCQQKPCCAAKSAGSQSAQLQVGRTCAGMCSAGCPCCTEAAAPTIPFPQQSQVPHQDQSTFAILAELPPAIPPVGSTAYMARAFESPPGHPSLSLHALYRVWLN